MPTDPVCGMSVDSERAPRAEHAGETYYFCCGGCRERFLAEPERYLERRAALAAAPSMPVRTGGHARPLPLAMKAQAPNTTAGTTVIDPVCGMSVDPASAKFSHEHGGKTYSFCSRSCLERFAADPERYFAKAQPQAADRPAARMAPAPQGTPGATYTCPMHPEIRED